MIFVTEIRWVQLNSGPQGIIDMRLIECFWLEQILSNVLYSIFVKQIFLEERPLFVPFLAQDILDMLY